jgi:multidrug efflux pump subunit AcrB
LLPTAYGIIGQTDAFVSPMVMAMMWGLLIGTPSVLIAIPVFYKVAEKMRRKD